MSMEPLIVRSAVTVARLSQPHPPGYPPDIKLQRSRPSLLTTAACSGLRPEPDCRPRRTYLHLSYSYASPFGPAIPRDTRPNPVISNSNLLCCTTQLSVQRCGRVYPRQGTTHETARFLH